MMTKDQLHQEIIILEQQIEKLTKAAEKAHISDLAKISAQYEKKQTELNQLYVLRGKYY